VCEGQAWLLLLFTYLETKTSTSCNRETCGVSGWCGGGDTDTELLKGCKYLFHVALGKKSRRKFEQRFVFGL
jgi:hypothetical protein